MGLTMSRAAEWTSTSGEGRGGKLEYTAVNNEILTSIVQWIETFLQTRGQEVSHLTFHTPLAWYTTLTPDLFTGNSEYKKRCVCDFISFYFALIFVCITSI